VPDQSLNRPALRAGHSFVAYLSVYRGAEVLEATVGATPLDQAKNLTITVVSGSASAVKAGYRVDVYTSGGDYKGRTRVRYGGTISSTNLPIREHSQGVARIASGDTVRVYADVRLSDKLVTATAAFNPDDLAYSDQGANPPPVPCSGGWWAGWASWVTGSQPLPFTGSTSFYIDPDSDGPLSHSWTWPSGITASSTTAADPNVTAIDAGEYLVTHVVTDADNSKSATQYVGVIAHDETNPPYEVVVEEVSGDEEYGHRFNVRVFEDADRTSIPDGAFCILWKEEYIDGARQSFGMKSAGRSHILGIGYIRSEEGAFDSEDGVESLSFAVISPLARLGELVGYSKVMSADATPDSWMQLKTLGVKRAMCQLWQFYTNASEAGFDLVFDSNYSDALYPELYLQKTTPLEQMRELAHGRKARMVSDRTGRFSVHLRPDLIAISSRASVTKTITLDTYDILGWRYTREHWRPVEMLECRGFTAGANGNVAVFSRWPGLAPGQGNQWLTIERLIENSQSAINQSAGQFGASSDGVYTDLNGVEHAALDLELTLPGSYHVADFYNEYIAINLTTALRGLDLSDHLFALRSVRLELDDSGTAQCVWTLRTVTNSASGVTYHPPAQTDNGLPNWTPIANNWDFAPLPDVVIPPYDWDEFPVDAQPAKIVLLGTGSAQVARAWSLPSSGGAVFEVVNSGVTGNPLWLRSDPFDYRRKFLTTTTGLFRCDDFWAASPVWTLVKAPTDFPTVTAGNYPGVFQMSINRQGFMYFSSGKMGFRSFDYGQTIEGPFPIKPGDSAIGVSSWSIFDISHYNEGIMVSANHDGWPGWAGGYRVSVSRSLDWGETWATIIDPITYANSVPPTGPSALIPYRRWDGSANNNADGQIEWWYKDVTKFSQYKGLANTGGVAGTSYANHISAMMPYNAVLVTSGQRAYGAYGTSGIYRIDPTNVLTPLPACPVGGPHCGLQGFGMNPDVVFAYQDNVVNGAHLSFDAGLTWTLVGANGWMPRYMELDLSDYIPAA
jgi:hypothetical protein